MAVLDRRFAVDGLVGSALLSTMKGSPHEDVWAAVRPNRERRGRQRKGLRMLKEIWKNVLISRELALM